MPGAEKPSTGQEQEWGVPGQRPGWRPPPPQEGTAEAGWGAWQMSGNRRGQSGSPPQANMVSCNHCGRKEGSAGVSQTPTSATFLGGPSLLPPLLALDTEDTQGLSIP